jgi:putative redox protein
MEHQVVTNWRNGLAFDVSQPGGDFTIDAEAHVGGQGLGPHPKPLMLSALAGCTEMDVASLFKKMRAEPEGFKVLVSGTLTEEHPKYYNKVSVEYQFFGENLKRAKLEKCVNLSVERYCGVFEMFRQFAEIETKISYFETVPA